MNRDLMLFAVWLGFPLMIGLAVYVSHKGSLSGRRCPHCSKTIPWNTRELAIPCPECGVSPEGLELLPTGCSRQQCRRCETVTPCWILWDRQPYCEQCLSEASPQLLAVASSPWLKDALRPSGREAAWNGFRFSIGAILAFSGGLSLLVAVSGSPWSQSAQVFLSLLFVTCPMALMWTWLSWYIGTNSRFKVMVWGGELLVQFEERITRVPLAGCSWREGTLQQRLQWHLEYHLRGQLLLINVPAPVRALGPDVPVGFTAQSREVWRAFFEISDLPITPSDPPQVASGVA